jgi:glucose 1-dehydrogenase
VLDVSLKSAFYRTQPSAKQLMAQGDGDRIIKVTSMHEDWPIPGNTADCHWKCVVGVGPGAVETPVNTATMNDPGALKRLDVALPIGRMAKPSEIGSEVVILASPGASYMTATTVFAGGAIMQSTPGW